MKERKGFFGNGEYVTGEQKKRAILTNDIHRSTFPVMFLRSHCFFVMVRGLGTLAIFTVWFFSSNCFFF